MTSCTVEIHHNPESSTQTLDNLSASQHFHNFHHELVVFKEKSSIVKVFRPRSKHITFGRSSSCSITLKDKCFSRLAGEIILGPVPLLKISRFKNKNDEYISMISGKYYRIGPYKIILMKPGDVVLNQKNKSPKRKNQLLISIWILISVLGLSSGIISSQGRLVISSDRTTKGSTTKTMRQDINGYDGNNNEIKIRIEEAGIGDLRPTINRNRLNTPINILKVNSTKAGHIERKQPVVPDKLGSTGIKQNIIVTGDDLDTAIQEALLMVNRGNLITAGRILKPLIPHASKEQRSEIIGMLDPFFQNHFKKAYMLMAYEPGKARDILCHIMESDLDLLPSFHKAKRLLEDTSNDRD